MTADNQGNDLDSVKNVLTSKIIVAPYVAGKTLTASQIAPSVADPITELGDVFGSGSAAVGLITSDGAPQDARDGARVDAGDAGDVVGLQKCVERFLAAEV